MSGELFLNEHQDLHVYGSLADERDTLTQYCFQFGRSINSLNEFEEYYTYLIEKSQTNIKQIITDLKINYGPAVKNDWNVKNKEQTLFGMLDELGILSNRLAKCQVQFMYTKLNNGFSCTEQKDSVIEPRFTPSESELLDVESQTRKRQGKISDSEDDESSSTSDSSIDEPKQSFGKIVLRSVLWMIRFIFVATFYFDLGVLLQISLCVFSDCLDMNLIKLQLENNVANKQFSDVHNQLNPFWNIFEDYIYFTPRL